MAIRGIDFKWLVTLLSHSNTIISLLSQFSSNPTLSLLSGTMDFSFPCSPPACILFTIPLIYFFSIISHFQLPHLYSWLFNL
jgi:hypothetical protein